MFARQLTTDTSKCHLLGGYVSDAIQLGLGLCAIGSLVYKRHVERPQRPWKIWFFDVSKQLVGGFIVHCSNILVAEILASGDDECAWYFLNFFVDCTIGVGIVFLSHGLLCSTLQKLGFSSFNHIGDYGDPPNKLVWLAQCSVYITALLINKLIVCSIFILTLTPVNNFADWMFSPLWPTPELELVVVMILCPFLLTSLQFLMFDYMLKAQPDYDDPKYSGVGNVLVRKDTSNLDSASLNGSSYLSIDFASSLPSHRQGYSSNVAIEDEDDSTSYSAMIDNDISDSV